MRSCNLLYLILTLSLLGCDNPVQEVFTNYNEHKYQIQRTIDYFSEIKPTNLKLYIMFDTENMIDLKIDQKDYWDKASWDTSGIFNKYGEYHRFNINVNDTSLTKAFRLLKLDKGKINDLKAHLTKAGCNSISNGFLFSDNVNVGFTSIGYPTHDMYALYYVIFEREIEPSIIDHIIQACYYKAINNSVLVEYGGPAFGSDCFPDK